MPDPDVFGWRRGWISPDGHLPLVADAWLHEEDYLEMYDSGVVVFEDVKDVPCLLMIGEPGSGKSHVLRHAAEQAAVTKGPDDEVLLFDLGEPSSALELRQRLFGAPEVERFRASTGRLFLFLDALDEAKVQIRKAVSILEAEIGLLDLERLVVRITCRTADRPQGFEEWLSDRFGIDSSRTLELTPLRQSDTRIAASAAGLEPAQFVEQVLAAGVEALAARPLTLKLLIRVFQTSGNFPDRLGELYLSALREMASEHDDERRLSRHLSATQSLAVASRIAAATVLSGRDVVDHQGQDLAGGVRLEELAGDSEVDRLIAVPTNVTVDDVALAEVLGTALFSARGRGLGWAHKTFGEYLAAYWLAAPTISDSQIGDLLFVDDGVQRRVVPQLRNVAAWLLTMRPTFASELASADAVVMLYGDPASVDPQQRRLLVEALVDAIGDQELDRFDIRWVWSRLHYDGIAADLVAMLTDRSRHQQARQAAADAIAQLKLAEVADALTDVALSPAETVPLRTSALHSLKGIISQELAQRLRPLALDPQIADVDDEVKGAALRICWPNVITADELFAGLTPEKNESLLGTYVIFLRRECAPHLETPDDLVAGVRWASQVPREYHATRDVTYLADVIVAKAWPLAADNGTLANALADLVVKVSEQNVPLLATAASLREDDAPDSALEVDGPRRAVIGAVIEQVGSGDIGIDQVRWSVLSLLRAGDMTWMLSQRAVASVEAKGAWDGFIGEMIGRDRGIDELFELQEEHQDLFALVASHYAPILLDSPEAEAQRSAWSARQAASSEPPDPPGPTPEDLNSMVVAEMDRFEAGDSDAFWRLHRPLLAEDDGTVRGLEFADDLASSSGWGRASEALRTRILDASERYLRSADPEPDRWIGRNKMFWPAWAGYRALRLLWRERPAAFEGLDDDVWRRWASVVMGWPSIHREVADEFEQVALDAVRRVAPDDARRFMGEWLNVHLTSADLAEAQARLAGLWDSSIEDQLLNRLLQQELAETETSALASFLIESGRDEALVWALEQVSVEAINDPDRSQHTLRLVDALARGPVRPFWDLIQGITSQDASAGRQLLGYLSHGRGSTLNGRLDPRQIGDLFTILENLFPPTDEVSEERSGAVTTGMEVSFWRGALLEELAKSGTPEAVLVLRDLESTFDEVGWIRRLRHRGEEHLRRAAWKPPTPADVVQLGTTVGARYVADSAALSRLLIQTLDQLAADMRGAFPLAATLWNTAPHMIPKAENEVSNVLGQWLRSRLRGRRAVVNREVEINAHPGGAGGDRTDLLVQAVGQGGDTVSVIIEVKGAWNNDLMTAMEMQLVAQYLKPDLASDGIYLVAWFSDEKWDGFDTNQERRRQRATRDDPEELSALLVDQAARVSSGQGVNVRAYVMDCSL